MNKNTLLRLASVLILGAVISFFSSCDNGDDPGKSEETLYMKAPDCLIKTVDYFDGFVSGVAQLTYSPDSLLTNFSLKGNSGTSQYTVTYFKSRLPATISSSGKTLSFTYDKKYRLVKRVLKRGGTTQTDTVIYDNDSRLLQVKRTDDNGIEKFDYIYGSDPMRFTIQDSIKFPSEPKAFLNAKITVVLTKHDPLEFNILDFLYENKIYLPKQPLRLLFVDGLDKTIVDNSYTYTRNDKGFPEIINNSVNRGGTTSRENQQLTYDCK